MSGGKHPGASVPSEAQQRWDLLGTWVNPFDLSSFLRTIQGAIDSRRKTIITNHNINSLVQIRRHDSFRELYNMADFCFVDGAAVVGIAKLAGHDASIDNRIAVLDWIWPLLQLASRLGWRIVHVGSQEPTISIAREEIRQQEPELKMELLDGYFEISDTKQNSAVIEKVRKEKPDILLVGMGMPRQETWVLENYAALPACVIILVGGMLGYIGGDRPTPPRWIGRLGVEWLFRLATEPRRLWRRYLIEPLSIAPSVIRLVASRRRR